VTDNGRGANGDSVPGFGLQGLRERAEILGGQVTAAPRPEGGFSLAVELPG
jgi:signal transduction histidine kinase